MSTTLIERLTQGPASSRELQSHCGLSQPAVSRQLSQLGERIIRLHEGRSVRYALAVNAFGSGDAIPLHQIDAHGHPRHIATLRPLAHGGLYLEAVEGCPPLSAR